MNPKKKAIATRYEPLSDRFLDLIEMITIAEALIP